MPLLCVLHSGYIYHIFFLEKSKLIEHLKCKVKVNKVSTAFFCNKETWAQIMIGFVKSQLSMTELESELSSGDCTPTSNLPSCPVGHEGTYGQAGDLEFFNDLIHFR